MRDKVKILLNMYKQDIYTAGEVWEEMRKIDDLNEEELYWFFRIVRPKTPKSLPKVARPGKIERGGMRR